MWIDAAAWLRQELTELDFQVVVIDGEEVEGDLARALRDVDPSDELFLHVSGRLIERGVVRTATGRWLRLQALGDALAARSGEGTSVFAELLHDDDPSDALVAAEHVSWVVDALGARARGHSMMAAVRAASAPVEGLALTRLFVESARAASERAILSAANYERVVGLRESLLCAQSFTFVRGGTERERLSQMGHPTGPPPFASLPPQAPVLSFAAQRSMAAAAQDGARDPARDAAHDAAPDAAAGAAPPSPEDETPGDPLAEAVDARQWRRVVQLRRERLDGIEPARMRVRELVAIARILQAELDDPMGAIEALEQARAVDPTRVSVLQALRRGYERLGMWPQAYELLDALAQVASEPSDRAELLHAQALVALERLNDPDRAFQLLQAALHSDPAHERALATFDELCAARASMPEAAPVTNGVGAESPGAIAAAAPPPAPPRATPPVPAMPPVHATPPVPAMPPPPAPPPAMAVVATRGAPADAATDPSTLSVGAREIATLSSAFAHHWREGRTDAAFLAALALEELGGAGIEQRALLQQLRSVSPLRARGALDAGAWELLRASGSDDALASLFAAVSRAAVKIRLEELVARRRLVALDPARRLDEASTASVVRTFHWASRVLGVTCPALYVVDQVPGDLAAVRAQEPSTALGASILSGRSSKDLAFLTGRHLTYYRPEHQVLIYYPTSDDLGRLLAAALDLGARPGSSAPLQRGVSWLRDRLSAEATSGERAAMAAAARRLNGASDLGRWARSIELTAGRAGLLLCGDLATACGVVRSESRAIANLSTADRRDDLIAFCSSPEHAELRARFAVIAPDGTQPPAAHSP